MQWAFFLGAFYLYCINCVFIGIATFLIIKYLNYPAKKQVNERQQKQVKVTITILITAMLLPSGYLAYSLYREQQFKKNTEAFIESEFTSKGYTVIYRKTGFNGGKQKIELAFLSHRFADTELARLDSVLDKNRYLKGTELVIRHDSTDRFTALKGDILSQIKNSENELSEKDVKIVQLEEKLAKNSFDNSKLLKEARALFPEINSLSVANHQLVTAKDSLVAVTAVIYDTPKELKQADKDKLRNWLNQRLL